MNLDFFFFFRILDYDMRKIKDKKNFKKYEKIKKKPLFLKMQEVCM